MNLTRRELLEFFGATALTGLVGPFARAQGDPSSAAPRMPLEEFVQSDARVAALRKGVRAMKQRKPSDPLSWFYQAAVHGVTDDAIKAAADQDPAVDQVFKKRYWNQCPHDGENSANFLPWHRAYTYHFEKVLRMHTEDDSFSLPYWNYTEKANRKFPKEFGINHLNGNMNDDSDANINPLYMKERDFYFCEYEHPFATGLPLLELTDSAVDISLPMAATVFFGETEREGLGGGIADEDPSTRGLLESYPHDQVHRSVGGIVGDTVGAMATPPTAAFDPIFPIHHSNIDRLWATWSCMPGKQWGKLPSDYWFNERAWYFHDTDGKVVNEPRKAYFDYRALGVRFKYEDMSCTPLALPKAGAAASELFALRQRKIQRVAAHENAFGCVGHLRSVIPLAREAKTGLADPLRAAAARADAAAAPNRLIVRLRNVQLGLVPSTGFDVHITATPDGALSRSDRSFVGSIGMFVHGAGHGGTGAGHGAQPAGGGQHESFDASAALAALGADNLDRASLVLVPYSLLSVPGKSTIVLTNDGLKINGMDFLSIE